MQPFLHAPFARRGSNIAAELFAGSQSPFAADVTPIAAAGSGTTRSRKSSVDFEWLAPVFDTPVAGSEAPTPTPSIGLNTARIYEGSVASTPTGSYISIGDDSKKAATTSVGSAFFLPMPDNGPSMRMRELGA